MVTSNDKSVKHLTFWFDVISPYAYLAFERLPLALEGLSYSVDYKPILFAGLLSHWGQKGPAEIAPKRDWTYRHVKWIADQNGITLQAPTHHPFNSLPLLRLILAAGPNRHVVEAAFHHVWRGGGDASDAARLLALQDHLKPARDPSGVDVKDELRAHTQEAIDRQVFGVPTIECDGKLFFGDDSLPMVAASLRGDAWFTPGGAWDAMSAVGEGVKRKPKG